MARRSEAFFDWVKAERAADMMAGDNPGLVVWIVEGWGSPTRYDDGAEGEDLIVVWGATDEEAQAEVDSYAWAMWERQYDATKQKEPADG